MTLLADIVEQSKYGTAANAIALAVDASPTEKYATVLSIQYKLHAYDYSDQGEKKILEQALAALKGQTSVVASLAAKGTTSNTTKFLLGGIGLVAAWYFFTRK